MPAVAVIPVPGRWYSMSCIRVSILSASALLRRFGCLGGFVFGAGLSWMTLGSVGLRGGAWPQPITPQLGRPDAGDSSKEPAPAPRVKQLLGWAGDVPQGDRAARSPPRSGW